MNTSISAQRHTAHHRRRPVISGDRERCGNGVAAAAAAVDISAAVLSGLVVEEAVFDLAPGVFFQE